MFSRSNKRDNLSSKLGQEEPLIPVPDPSTQGSSEPQVGVPLEHASPGILQIALRHRWLTIAPVLVLIALGAAIGFVRDPVYTASAQLHVGGPAVPGPLISITSQGSQELASVYSRFIDARDVTGPVASRLGLDSAEVVERLSASPIPESPIFRVEGQGTSAAEAVELTNAATASLIAFVRNRNAEDPQGQLLLRRFTRAVQGTQEAAARRDQAQARFDRSPSSPETTLELHQATAAFEAAQLREATLRDLYSESQAGLAGSRVVQVLDPASAATSDRFSVLQLLLFVCVVGGLAVGIGLAHLRERSLRRRVGYRRY